MLENRAKDELDVFCNLYRLQVQRLLNYLNLYFLVVYEVIQQVLTHLLQFALMDVHLNSFRFIFSVVCLLQFGKQGHLFTNLVQSLQSQSNMRQGIGDSLQFFQLFRSLVFLRPFFLLFALFSLDHFVDLAEQDRLIRHHPPVNLVLPCAVNSLNQLHYLTAPLMCLNHGVNFASFLKTEVNTRLGPVQSSLVGE